MSEIAKTRIFFFRVLFPNCRGDWESRCHMNGGLKLQVDTGCLFLNNGSRGNEIQPPPKNS